MKRKIWFIFFIISFLLSACTNQKDNPVTELENFTPGSVAQEGLNIKPDEGLEIVKDIQNFTAVTDNQEYNFETDNQTAFRGLMYDDCIETKASYYFFQNHQLYVFDKKSRQYDILCAKPSCSHSYNLECNAYIDGGQNIEYYNGSIYVIAVERKELSESKDGLQKENLCLYQLSLDGTERQKICTLATAVAQTGAPDNCFSVLNASIHRGYLYYSYNYGTGTTKDGFYANNSNTLYRISLEGTSERECICAVEYGGSPQEMQLTFQGSYMYFIKPGQVNTPHTYGSLYRLNIESMKLEYMDIGEISCFFVDGDEIIYCNSEKNKYYSYNTKTWEKKVFFEPEPKEDMEYGYIICDENYYYITVFNLEKRLFWCEVYNKQLEKIAMYDKSDFFIEGREEQTPCCYQSGNSDYDFMVAFDGSSLYYLDKSLLESGTAEFIQVKAK